MKQLGRFVATRHLSSRQLIPTYTYPTASIETGWTVPVEISLIAQLSHGEGTSIYVEASRRQEAHAKFVDELSEPSTKIGSTRIDLNDKTALYTFTVGQGGHPFHRHEGHRVVVCIAGSGGADLRFSFATPDEVDRRSSTFVDKLHIIRVPADAIFTMRFDGRVWHQFAPTPCPTGILTPLNPAFFALSVHTDETNGNFDAQTREMIRNNKATIGSLTQLLPQKCLDEVDMERALTAAPLTKLSLAHGSGQEDLCRFLRGSVGAVKGSITEQRMNVFRRLTGAGFVMKTKRSDVRAGSHFVVRELTKDSENLPSWLSNPWQDVLPHAQHTDSFEMVMPALSTLRDGLGGAAPGEVGLEAVLDGFIENSPPSVSHLQAFRNALVRPLGLRTSPLGCPVSSLLGKSDSLFAGRFPVHRTVRGAGAGDKGSDGLLGELAVKGEVKAGEGAGVCVGVILGADDVHLRFRTLVGVDAARGVVYMSNKVQTLNTFGAAYLTLIDWVHRKYIVPKMLRFAAAFATATIENTNLEMMRQEERGKVNS